MEKYKPQAGFGSMFQKKDRKGSMPNMDGKFAVPFDCKAGDILQISAWTQESDIAGKYFSLKIGKEWVPETQPSPHGKVSPDKATPFTDMDDDIPF